MKQTAVRGGRIGWATGLVLAVGAGIAGTLAILILVELRDPGASDVQKDVVVPLRQRSVAPEFTRVPRARAVPEEAVAPSIRPWESTPENTPAEIPPGHIPAWEVELPPPDPNVPPPPEPVPPLDPASHRPTMDNPGGVNGDRPPRMPRVVSE